MRLFKYVFSIPQGSAGGRLDQVLVSSRNNAGINVKVWFKFCCLGSLQDENFSPKNCVVQRERVIERYVTKKEYYYMVN